MSRDRKGKKIKSVLKSAKKSRVSACVHIRIGKNVAKKVNYLRKSNARRRNIRRFGENSRPKSVFTIMLKITATGEIIDYSIGEPCSSRADGEKILFEGRFS